MSAMLIIAPGTSFSERVTLIVGNDEAILSIWDPDVNSLYSEKKSIILYEYRIKVFVLTNQAQL